MSKEWIAIGDSITEGYIDDGRNWHPFTTRLEFLLNENKFACKISNHGKSGEKTYEIKERLNAILALKKPHKFKYATLLTGLNDIGDIQNCPELFDLVLNDIQSMCNKLLKNGCRFVFLLTLPINPLDAQYKWYHILKIKFNDKIRLQCLSNPRIILIDIAKELSYETMTPTERKEFFCEPNDYLHFSAKGYDKLADFIFGKFVTNI